MSSKKTFSAASVRTALYIRVSGEEQKISGLSLEAQQERLVKYTKEHGWIIAGIYIDAAKTARKRIHKRVEFQRMLDDVRQDKIDLILICRLDRWFRNISDYYKVQEVLAAHNCGWKTTDEEYDTTTANGRLYINVKLSIAQNESDICGERIEVVFDSKVSHGTVVSGSVPFGYSINKDKRLEIIPEQAAIVQDAFARFESTISKRGTVRYIRETYGVNWCEATFRRMLSEKLYTGVYDRGGRYNDHFCPAIISNEQFLHVGSLLSRNARCAPSGSVYIFTSILVCAECGHKLVGIRTNGIMYYRCNQHFQRGRCSQKRSLNELKLEAWLFENLGSELERYRTSWELKAAERKRSSASVDKAAIKGKLTRLKELYLNNLIDIEEYKNDFAIYTATLEQIPEVVQEKPPNFESIEALLQSGYKKIYDSLAREEKRTLWRSIIKEIRIDGNLEVTGIIFA